jgi:hypothetical protein
LSPVANETVLNDVDGNVYAVVVELILCPVSVSVPIDVYVPPDDRFHALKRKVTAVKLAVSFCLMTADQFPVAIV